jgi:hypothetical protein
MNTKPWLVASTLVVVAFVGCENSNEKKTKAAYTQISAFCTVAEVYQLDAGHAPESFRDFVRPDAPGQDVSKWPGPLDPRDNPYRLEKTESNRVKIASNGPDGKPNTEDDIAKELAPL